MATENYAELYKKAIEENGGGSEVLPDGLYNVKIGSVKSGASKSSNKPQVGIRLQVLDGPHEGKSTWVNQTFTADNPQAVAIFLRIMQSLGVPSEAVAAGLPPEKLAEYIVIGSTGVATLSSHTYNGKKFQDLKSFTLSATAPAATHAAPAPAAEVPAAVPAPQVPAPVPAPASAAPAVPAPEQVPVPVPTAPGQPAF